MIKTLGFMAVGGTLGWGGGFLLMMFKASMQVGDITAIFYPIGGAFVGVIAGAVVAAA